MSTTAASPPLFTVREIAERIRSSQEHVLDLIRSHRLMAVNIGLGTRRPRWRIPAEALEQFLAARTAQPTPTKRRKKRQMGMVTEFF